MTRRIVDLIAPGPPTADPYAPAAPAWALAAGFARLGDAVQVVHPAGDGGPPPPPGVATVAFPSIPRHVGSARGDAELAHAARQRLRPTAELVVRDPLRPGALGLPHGTHGPRLLALVRAAELDAGNDDPSTKAPVGLRGRIDRWRERTVLYRLEREALEEAETLYCEGPELLRSLAERFGLPASRLRELPRAVALPDPAPTREGSRDRIGIPHDDPLVVALAAADDPNDPGLARTREAFVRIRPLFAGAHLVLAGASAASGNAITVVPSRDLESLATAIAAADVAVFPTGTAGPEPGVLLALRSAVACVVAADSGLPAGADGAVRRLAGGDAGDLASVLAELLADPAGRRELASRARNYGERFAPERVASGVAAASAA